MEYNYISIAYHTHNAIIVLLLCDKTRYFNDIDNDLLTALKFVFFDVPTLLLFLII